jgi:RNA polymerase sigma-70 factor (ECF subfamily)
MVVSGQDLPPDPDALMPTARITDRRESLQASPDEVLVVRARTGEPEALAALYARYADPLYTLALRLAGAPADAEDALHDLFVGLPELLRRYDERGRLESWLKGVIARLVLVERRTARRREDLVARAADADLPQSTSQEPWSAIDLDRALAALPDSLRAVFVLRQVEGYSHDDIATLLGISSGASRVRFLRAVRQLRFLLEPRQ